MEDFSDSAQLTMLKKILQVLSHRATKLVRS